MVDAYINLTCFNKKIQISYLLSQKIEDDFKTIGFTSLYDTFGTAKTKLLEIIEKSHEEKITIKSRKFFPASRGYSKMGLNKLKDIREFLSKKKPDITFKLLA